MHRHLLFLIIFLTITNTTTYSQNNNPSLKQMVGQMLMLGFRDTVLNESSHIINDIKDLNIGGVVLYEYDVPSKLRPRNITSKKQLKQLNKDLQSFAKTPLFIGIDEEGGRVTRLKTSYGFKPTVSAQKLGEWNNPDSTKKYALRIAKACKSVGVNMNFAPVVDVNTNPDCPVIGAIERSFSNNPDLVSTHAQLYMNEHQKEGVFCTLKHFPGHGSALMDSHLGFTDISETWNKEELSPYKKLLAESDFPMVMTSHVFNKNIDSVYPTTLSKTTLNILRNKLNFEGIILSDDMMMLAIADNFGLEESILLAIQAGVDVLIFSNNINHYNASIGNEIVEIILDLVANEKLSMERIKESYDKILKAKATLL